MKPTPYAELNAVLLEVVKCVQGALNNELVGAYLQGSFAIGDFDEHSDVDFVIAICNEPSNDHVTALRAIHEQIFDLGSEWARHLEGSYFPTTTLRDYRRGGTPLWYLDHGSRTLVRSDHCNTIVVRSVLREHGVILVGPNPATLVDPIPVDALRHEIGGTIRGWGRQVLDEPDAYHNRFYQGYLVLSYCRMLHDLIEGRPGSKRAGAAWAKANLDPAWGGLIDRAWACRPNPATAVREPPDHADYERTLEFVRYIMRESERY